MATKKRSTYVSSAGAVFPRLMLLINDMAQAVVIARTHLPHAGSAPVLVQDEDELTRIQTDIDHVLEISDQHAPKEPVEGEEPALPALRITEAEAEAEPVVPVDPAATA